MQSRNNANSEQESIDFQIGQYDIFFKKSYKVLYTINDLLIGIWFLIGSFMFFNESTKTAGVWLFVIGSFELLIRPVIKLIHDFHLKRHIENEYKKKPSE